MELCLHEHPKSSLEVFFHTIKYRNIGKKQTHWGSGLKRNTCLLFCWIILAAFCHQIVTNPVKHSGESDSKHKGFEEFHSTDKSSLSATVIDCK